MAALTRERIVEAAVTMADREGFEAVTLRRIAGDLGVHVTSLYNHVPTREAVTDGIIERLVEEAQLPSAPADWEEWVRGFFAGIGQVAGAHPGAFAALQRRPVQGPRAAASFEVALDAFAAAGLSPTDAYNAVKATALAALAVGLERSLAERDETPETAIADLPPERFPRVRSLDELTDPEPVWGFSLETLVSGLRVQIERRSMSAPAR